MAFLNEVINLYFSRTSFFIKLILEHLYLSLIAILVISFFGISLGILISRYEKAAPLVLNIVNFLYTIPSIALFGFLVSVTGIGNKSALIALILYGMLPMIRNTYTGIREVDAQIIEAAKGMGSTERQLLFKIQLPLALPFIITGFRTMVVMTIALTGIASFIGAGGLGVAIWRGITTNFPALTFAGSILVALMAITADLLLGFVEKKIYKKIYGNPGGLIQ